MTLTIEDKKFIVDTVIGAKKEVLDVMQTEFGKQKKEILEQVQDAVDSSVAASEQRITKIIHTEVSDLAEVNKLALRTLDNHEERLVVLEARH